MANVIFISLGRNQVGSVPARLNIPEIQIHWDRNSTVENVLRTLELLFHDFRNMMVFRDVMLKLGRNGAEYCTRTEFAYAWHRPHAIL